jgi:hypothetical protein
MAILRWIHLRKLVPLSDLIQGLESTPSRAGSAAATAGPVRNTEHCFRFRSTSASCRAGASRASGSAASLADRNGGHGQVDRGAD